MTSSLSLPAGSARRLAVLALLALVLSVTAAVISFVMGDVLMGVVWVLMVGLSSNMGWYYLRRLRQLSRAAERVAAAPAAACSAADPDAGPRAGDAGPQAGRG